MIRQCAILFGCLALGELIVYLTGIKLPSSIIGYAAAHPLFEIRLDQTAVGAGIVRLSGS